MVHAKVPAKQFEQVFGIFTPETELRDVSVFRETESDRQAEREIEREAAIVRETSAEVYYSEKQSETHRGANTEWDKHDALTHSHSDHWSTTKFETDGQHIIYPDERFQRTPLLDIETLSRILTKMVQNDLIAFTQPRSIKILDREKLEDLALGETKLT